LGSTIAELTLKRDADAWDREVDRRQQLGPLAIQQLTARGGPTLGEWVEQRWAPEHAATLAPATRDRYANAYSVHIAPSLDAVPLTQFSGPLLHAWQADRVRAGISPGTIRKARTLLSSILRHAAESGAIVANPLSLVRAPRAQSRDAVHPLSPVVVERIRAVMVDPPQVRSKPRRTPSGHEGATHFRHQGHPSRESVTR
jgi:hypothetical protein